MLRSADVCNAVYLREACVTYIVAHFKAVVITEECAPTTSYAMHVKQSPAHHVPFMRAGMRSCRPSSCCRCRCVPRSHSNRHCVNTFICRKLWPPHYTSATRTTIALTIVTYHHHSLPQSQDIGMNTGNVLSGNDSYSPTAVATAPRQRNQALYSSYNISFRRRRFRRSCRQHLLAGAHFVRCGGCDATRFARDQVSN